MINRELYGGNYKSMHHMHAKKVLIVLAIISAYET
jgi:hypothetical protein